MAVSLVRSSKEHYALAGTNFVPALGSLACWVNMADNNTQAIVSFNSGTTGSFNGFGGSGGLEVHLAVNTSFNATHEDGAGNARTITSGTVSTGTWQHLLMTWDVTGQLTLYLDGSSTGTPQSFGSSGGNSATNGRIGQVGQATSSRAMNGRIAEVGLWDAELTASEALALAAGATPPLVRASGLIGYWPCYRDVATQPDIVGNDNGTRVATPDTYVHPPIYMPHAPYIVTAPGAPPATAHAGPLVNRIPLASKVGGALT